jgi:acyl-CoA thioester hydrolase
MDTDAAGIWHHSTVTRWTEEAEAELHRGLGIIDETFGATPRVHLEYDFKTALEFDDEVDVHLSVGKVGESSVEYLLRVTNESREVASGRLVAVLIDRSTRGARAWPDRLRRALEGAVTPSDPD